MQHPDKKGYVYILVNPAFSGFLKVGRTTKEPEIRARELSAGTGVPAPYAVAWDALVTDCEHVERLIHQRLSSSRSRNDREFFVISLKKAISIISQIVEPYSCEVIEPKEKAAPDNHHSIFLTEQQSTERTEIVSTESKKAPSREDIEKAVMLIREDYLNDEQFHFVRHEAEANARRILNESLGGMTPTTIRKFLEYMNTENIKGKTGLTRFGRHFTNIISGQISNHPKQFNEHIGALWTTDEITLNETLEKYTKNAQITGGGTLLPTFVLYLRNPSKFTICTKTLLNNIKIFIPYKKFNIQHLCSVYVKFNHAVYENLAIPFRLNPHEIDLVISKLNKYLNFI
jgi:hypothetical protein